MSDSNNAYAPSSNAHRALFTIAFVSHALNRSSDLLSGILPLFSPVLAGFSGEVFSAKKFTDSVMMFYGISINPFVVEELVPRMAKAGLLRREGHDDSGALYVCIAPPMERSPDTGVVVKVLDTAIAAFKNYANSLSSIAKFSYSDEQVEEILLHFLVRMPNPALVASVSSTDMAKRLGTPSLAYVVNRFLVDLEKTDKDLFTSLANISAAAMVGEVVLDLRSPPEVNRTARDLTIFLDQPIIASLLGIYGHERKNSVLYIYDMLKKLRCRLCTFPHYIDELRGIIYAVLEKPAALRSGSLGDALRDGDFDEMYLVSIGANPDSLIEDLGITIQNPAISQDVRSIGYFDEERIERFKNELRSWHNEQAVQRDALSISYIMRQRKGSHKSDPLKTKFIFVTENRTLMQRSTTFCRNEGLISPYQVGPAIDLRRLAALLWVTLGNEVDRVELSRRQLLANCSLAVKSSPDVIDKMINTLKKWQPERLAELDVLLSQPRSTQLLMDVTLGSEKLINGDNIDEILRIVRQSAIREETERFEAKLSEKDIELTKVRDEHRYQLAQLQASLDKEVDKMRQDFILRDKQHQHEIDKLNITVHDLSNELRRVYNVEQCTIESLVKRIWNLSVWVTNFAKIVLAAALIVIFAGAAILGSGLVNTSRVCIAIFVVAGILVTTIELILFKLWRNRLSRFYDAWFKWRVVICNNLLRRRAISIGLEEEIDYRKIDWQSGCLMSEYSSETIAQISDKD